MDAFGKGVYCYRRISLMRLYVEHFTATRYSEYSGEVQKDGGGLRQDGGDGGGDDEIGIDEDEDEFTQIDTKQSKGWRRPSGAENNSSGEGDGGGDDEIGIDEDEDEDEDEFTQIDTKQSKGWRRPSGAENNSSGEGDGGGDDEIGIDEDEDEFTQIDTKQSKAACVCGRRRRVIHHLAAVKCSTHRRIRLMRL